MNKEEPTSADIRDVYTANGYHATLHLDGLEPFICVEPPAVVEVPDGSPPTTLENVAHTVALCEADRELYPDVDWTPIDYLDIPENFNRVNRAMLLVYLLNLSAGTRQDLYAKGGLNAIIQHGIDAVRGDGVFRRILRFLRLA